MSKLYKAAQAWERLLDKKYCFTYEKKRRLHDIVLFFQAEHFFHLTGVSYLRGIDFSKYRFAKASFLQQVLDNKMNTAAMEDNAGWSDIRGRIEAIIQLETMLDAEFLLYQFNPQVLGSKIDAKYLIKDQTSHSLAFLFVDGALEASYCKSILTTREKDYSQSQTKLKLLRKIKIQAGGTEIIFDHIQPR